MLLILENHTDQNRSVNRFLEICKNEIEENRSLIILKEFFFHWLNIKEKSKKNFFYVEFLTKILRCWLGCLTFLFLLPDGRSISYLVDLIFLKRNVWFQNMMVFSQAEKTSFYCVCVFLSLSLHTHTHTHTHTHIYICVCVCWNDRLAWIWLLEMCGKCLIYPTFHIFLSYI